MLAQTLWVIVKTPGLLYGLMKNQHLFSDPILL